MNSRWVARRFQLQIIVAPQLRSVQHPTHHCPVYQRQPQVSFGPVSRIIRFPSLCKTKRRKNRVRRNHMRTGWILNARSLLECIMHKCHAWCVLHFVCEWDARWIRFVKWVTVVSPVCVVIASAMLLRNGLFFFVIGLFSMFYTNFAQRIPSSIEASTTQSQIGRKTNVLECVTTI